jgi:hypothetical protein
MLREMATEGADLVRMGVAAMCGVADAHFNEKHWGAAVIAAGLFAGEQPLASAARSALIVQAERLVDSKAEWFPPPIDAGPGEAKDVVSALAKSAATLHFLGHDTIFAALALSAMSNQPDLATSANVEALVSMIEFASTLGPGGPFAGWDDPAVVRAQEGDEIPSIETMEDLAISAATVFAGAGTVYDGFDRGVVQHVLTHAYALIELHRLGHTGVVSSGIEAHRTYRKLMTRRPSSGEHALSTTAAAPAFRSAQYWQQDLRGRGDWLYGHVFKVARAWTGLEPLLPVVLQQRAKAMLATSMIVT